MNPVGTLAYVIDEEAVLVRVNKGWQYIAVSMELYIAGYILLGWSLNVYHTVHYILTVIFQKMSLDFPNNPNNIHRRIFVLYVPNYER